MGRTFLAAALFVAGIATASAAELSRKIKAIDVVKGTITLTDGMTFVLPESVKPADLAIGEKVKVTYRATGKTNTASQVVAVK